MNVFAVFFLPLFFVGLVALAVRIYRKGVQNKRAVFYPILIGIFWFFFLLHWNGMFDFTYWWVLERVNGTHSFLPQVTAAFLSAIIIFSVPVFLFELKLRLGKQGRTLTK